MASCSAAPTGSAPTSATFSSGSPGRTATTRRTGCPPSSPPHRRGTEAGPAPADGDAEAYETIGDAVGIAIANLITLFAPPKVILAGAALSLGERLLGAASRAVANFTPPSLADVSEIVVHDWGDDIWARGAAAMTLRDLYGAPWNTTGPARHR